MEKLFPNLNPLSPSMQGKILASEASDFPKLFHLIHLPWLPVLAWIVKTIYWPDYNANPLPPQFSPGLIPSYWAVKTIDWPGFKANPPPPQFSSDHSSHQALSCLSPLPVPGNLGTRDEVYDDVVPVEVEDMLADPMRKIDIDVEELQRIRAQKRPVKSIA
ncbi:hypothetical protein NE237_031655 [Protea cynaroides]|uniref:Uncharacterized protein n=1 Tax=Protea cynaroides TaxID=273540 RepID=A0A9Q0R2D4_9MAGN|nr:hypothetical protein NE237_031655 [Protea cynaroides]